MEHPGTAAYTAADGVGFQRWSSPLPYLFGGLALVLVVVALALVVLACSYRFTTPLEEEEKSEKAAVHALQPDMEPRIVVIMAGETNPTHLATPIAAVTRPHEQV